MEGLLLIFVFVIFVSAKIYRMLQIIDISINNIVGVYPCLSHSESSQIHTGITSTFLPKKSGILNIGIFQPDNSETNYIEFKTKSGGDKPLLQSLALNCKIGTFVYEVATLLISCIPIPTKAPSTVQLEPILAFNNELKQVSNPDLWV